MITPSLRSVKEFKTNKITENTKKRKKKKKPHLKQQFWNNIPLNLHSLTKKKENLVTKLMTKNYLQSYRENCTFKIDKMGTHKEISYDKPTEEQNKCWH